MTNRKRRLRRWLRRGGYLALIIGPIAFIVIWLAFHHKPAWYRPVTPDEGGLQRARRDTTRLADSFGDQLVKAVEFEITLRDADVNPWLAALPHLWPEVMRTWPTVLTEVAVAFQDGKARVGAHYADHGWHAIVSLEVTPQVSDDGTTILLSLAGAHAGSLPLPRRILDPFWPPLLNLRDRLSSRSNVPDRTNGTDGKVGPTALFGDIRVRNRFTWPNGDRPFRIDSITVEGGELRMRVEPL